MGRKQKNQYSKSLKRQVYERIRDMEAFGSSKRAAKANGTYTDKIFSFETEKTYLRHLNHYAQWMSEHHPEITTLKKARRYSREWLEEREASGRYSAWTLQIEAKAIGKLFGIKPGDPDYYDPPTRHRRDIKRSRTEVESDQHVSKERNRELIEFCRGTGLRRAGVESVRGRDLWSAERVEQELARIGAIPESERNEEDRMVLRICKDTAVFEGRPQWYIHVREKGGRDRLAPIIGEHEQEIVERFQRCAPDQRVWGRVNSHLDIHSLRAEYANRLYSLYARPLDSLPYDRVNGHTGRRFQSEVYECRGDQRGVRLDKRAMLVVSKALGHSRVDVFASNYYRQ